MDINEVISEHVFIYTTVNINVISTERCAVAVCHEVIISALLSGSILSIFRENDL